MPPPARSTPSLRLTWRTGELLASWFGLSIHRAARLTRQLFEGRRAAEPTNVAVLCDALLRYGSTQAIGLKSAGLNVTLYYVDRFKDSTGSDDEFAGDVEERARFLKRAHDAGVTVVALPRRRMLHLIGHVFSLHRDLYRRGIGIAVVQPHIDPRYSTLGFGLPVALMLHDPQPHSGDTLSAFPLPVRMMSRFAEMTSSCLIVHSTLLVDEIRPLLRRLPTAVVPHGAEMAPGPSPVPAERSLLVFGRLLEYKGVDTALEAFDLLSERFSDIELIVAGRGPLAALAANRRNVLLLDEYISDPELDRLLDGARLVLLPYKDSTQSGVGLLAIARGVPCVVTRTGALPELVEGSSKGLVVPPGDPESLAAAIEEHVDHDASLRRQIYDETEAKFAWPAVGRQLRSELERLQTG